MPEQARLLPLVGAFNFRDLGGYPARHDRVTRWETLFRSDSLHDLTDSDLELLRELGLSCVIDLRTPAELERTGRGPLEKEPIRFFHLPLIEGAGQAPPVAQENLAERYFWYLDVGRESFVQALSLAGDPASYPLVFHCAAGKDRTGVLAALVLSILGVATPVIVEDYVLTESRMDLILRRNFSTSDAEARIAEIPQFLLRAEAGTITTFLRQLDERYGGARQWAIDAGVPAACLEAMVDLLTVEIPPPVR